MKLYAIIDAGNAPDFFEQLQQHQPLHSCLYNPPVQDSLLPFAPFLVQLTSEPFKEWLVQLDTPWGLYLTSYVDFNTLRNHLRRHTYMQIPISKKPVIARYYDPRVIWEFTSVLSDEKLHAFLGPIEIVSTFFEGYYLQDHFGPRRESFPKGMKRQTMFLELTDEEYAALNQFSEERYIIELRDHMLSYVDPDIIERHHNHPDRIHRRMLEHERDQKGSAISHSADQQFLRDSAPSMQQPESMQQAFFEFLPNNNHWYKVRGSKRYLIKDQSLIDALTAMGRYSINENQFHQATDRVFMEMSRQLERPEDYPHAPSSKQPYFCHQSGQWYFIDLDDYAYPINVGDERLHVLIALATQNIHRMNDDDFHQFTRGKYQHLHGLPFLPEEKEDDEPYMPENWEEMEKAVYQLAREFYYFCRAQEIKNDRSIKGLTHCLMVENIFSYGDIPDTWFTLLNISHEAGYTRAETLMLKILGKIPKYKKVKL